jgi:hypothetical protein
VKVHYDEGVTTHIGPKPCIAGREARGEASAGDRIGQPLSHDMNILGADAVEIAEGNMDRRDSVSAWTTRRGQRTWHVQTLFAWKPGDPTFDRWHNCPQGPHREGEEP